MSCLKEANIKPNGKKNKKTKNQKPNGAGSLKVKGRKIICQANVNKKKTGVTMLK